METQINDAIKMRHHNTPTNHITFCDLLSMAHLCMMVSTNHAIFSLILHESPIHIYADACDKHRLIFYIKRR